MTTFPVYYNDIWSKTLHTISETGQVGPEVFEMYFNNSKLISLENNEAVVAVPHFIHYSILNQNVALIENCLELQLGVHLPVKVFMESELKKQQKTISVVNEFISRQIDINFTFDNFVVGKSNSQAHSAAMTCAMNPGVFYNPLFIYGGPGLGKTHLLNAIGNRIANNFPHKKIGFISALDFVDGVSKARNGNRFDEFKESFNNLDVLLVDDVQFIGGNKERSQEIFFSIFNQLVNNKKQICITADRAPADIQGLEDRIISRFNQGLNISIEAPEYETALNILKMKLANNSITQTIDDDVLSYIATNFSQDVRSLEGAINRLLFYSINFADRDHIDIQIASKAFKDQLIQNKYQLTIGKIQREICNYYNISLQQLCSTSRTKKIATARNIAIYLSRILLDKSYKAIGNEFGKRDHSTIINSCERIEKLLKDDPMYLDVINELKNRLK